MPTSPRPPPSRCGRPSVVDRVRSPSSAQLARRRSSITTSARPRRGARRWSAPPGRSGRRRGRPARAGRAALAVSDELEVECPRRGGGDEPAMPAATGQRRRARPSPSSRSAATIRSISPRVSRATSSIDCERALRGGRGRARRRSRAAPAWTRIALIACPAESWSSRAMSGALLGARCARALSAARRRSSRTPVARPARRRCRTGARRSSALPSAPRFSTCSDRRDQPDARDQRDRGHHGGSRRSAAGDREEPDRGRDVHQLAVVQRHQRDAGRPPSAIVPSGLERRSVDAGRGRADTSGSRSRRARGRCRRTGRSPGCPTARR